MKNTKPTVEQNSKVTEYDKEIARRIREQEEAQFKKNKCRD